ncbi:uncharacterized protein [Ptychodera flava]|uniref:uncharacterized protein n=1 Tax=Ptychodera flava TaxID=63121 RepID=UPI00396A8965
MAMQQTRVNSLGHVRPSKYRKVYGTLKFARNLTPEFNKDAASHNTNPDNNNGTQTEGGRGTSIPEPFSPIDARGGCLMCAVKDQQMVALQQHILRKEKIIQELENLRRSAVQELEKRQNSVAAARPGHGPCDVQSSVKQDTASRSTKRRGIQISKTRYIFITSSEEVPIGFERLGISELCVPTVWLLEVKAKSMDQGKSFLLKKLMDGFFTPIDLAGKNSGKLADNKIVQSLSLYAYGVLEMSGVEVTNAINSKCCSSKSALKRQLTA